MNYLKFTSKASASSEMRQHRRSKSMCRSHSFRSESPARRERSLSTKSEHGTRSSGASKHQDGILGYLRKPGHWAGAARRRIQREGLRKAFLPRRQARLDLFTTNDEDKEMDSGSFDAKPDRSNKYESESVDTRGTSMSSTQNESWNEDNPPRTRIKLLEELKNDPTKTREDLKQSAGGANLDDILDMAYRIRVSYDFDWEKVLEGDIEEECDEDVAMEEEEKNNKNRKSNARTQPRRARKRSSKEIFRPERPALHLQPLKESSPVFGPGILIS